MALPPQAHVLRIYIGENIRHGPLRVYEALIYRARMMNMAGATILKSHIGFGHAETSGARSYAISADLPILIEIVDTPDNILNFVPVAKELLKNRGLITLHEVNVLHQGSDTSSSTS